VRFYRAPQGVTVWLPDEADDASPISDEEEADEVEESEVLLFSIPLAAPLTDRRDYNSEHYIRVLRDSYAKRCAWCLRPRTSPSSSVWAHSKVCLIDPLN
jgi:DNA polymerase, archaea type